MCGASDNMGFASVLFENNYAGGAGGAFSIDLHTSSDNSAGINFLACSFHENVGRIGGAASVTIHGNGSSNCSILSSSFAGNSAAIQSGALDFDGGRGPGQNSVFRTSNSTFSGNRAGAGSGGGESCHAGAVSLRRTNAEIESCTIVDNDGTGSNALGIGVVGGFDVSDCNLTLNNTVLDRNSGVSTGSQDADALRHRGSGVFTDGDHNLINDTIDLQLGGLNAANNIVGTASLLGPLVVLRARGIDRALHYPGPGSPLIDAGMTNESSDQVGNARPLGVADDIGAIEGALAVADCVLARGRTRFSDGGTDHLVDDLVVNSTRTLVYTIDNSIGTDDLFIGGITTSNHSNVVSLQLASSPPTFIPAGGTAAVTFRFQIPAAGSFGFDIGILSNAVVPSYDLSVVGTGVLPTLGIPGFNDLTINGQGSGMRSCTSLTFVSPIPSLEYRVSSSSPGLPVTILFRSTPCSPQSMMVPSCNQTFFDLVYTPSIIRAMGMTGADGSFSLTVPVGSVPRDIHFSTQALIAHPCGPLFTQAFDVTLDDGI